MGPFYAQSWALTHMLLADSNYYKQSPKFLELMLGGADSAKAITGAYGRTLAQITKDLEAYIRTGQFILRLFDYKDPKARKDLETREATPFEAALVTANMQAISLRSQAEARAAFSKLEQENEAHLELQESIAAFEYRHGHRDDAMAHYARASALGSTNWQLYRDYGFLTTDMDLRTELFGKALNLNPNDLDLRIRYSDGLLRAGKHFQALAALVPVRKVDPKQAFMFFQLSARANAAAQQMDEARRAAGRAVEFASTPVEKDYATRLAKSLATPSSRPTSTQVSANTLDVADIAGVVDLDGSGSGRPRLVRRNDGTTADINALSLEEIRAINNESLVNGAKTVTAARFQALDCSGAQPIMIFAGEGGALRLSMKDPSTILLRGTGAATVSLSCGDQNDRRVRVGYNPEADPKTRTAGDVRFLEFQ